MKVRVETFFEDLMQDVQSIWESDAAAEWERITEPNKDAEKMEEAAYDVGNAYEKIGNAMDCLYAAMKTAKGTIAEDRIASLMNDLEDLQCDVLSMKFNLERGEF